MENLIWGHKAGLFEAGRFDLRADPPPAWEGGLLRVVDAGPFLLPGRRRGPRRPCGEEARPFPRTGSCHQRSVPVVPFADVHLSYDPESHYSPSKEKQIPFPTNESTEKSGEEKRGSGHGSLKPSVSPAPSPPTPT
ncbi:hypothetical protein HJG60_012105 [Phyllostomus discolor]|uniref:Uncharacterized protein n=1 Tax=Phyllostomus discolor TaxID=89673 RepID=A0A833ZLL3_9CHIR|nr:hypothetical protein HJG60_012105 [Phyllostomus discolor]